MRQFLAFSKKELMELIRTNKFVIVLAIFIIFGIMSPLTAKITPFLIETMSSEFGDMGINVSNIHIDAISSWEQLFKNLAMTLIVFIIMLSNTLTLEINKGTLVNMITKGLKRRVVIISKTLIIIGFWTLCYFVMFGITYIYNDILWDNSIANHLAFSIICSYVAGIFFISCIIFVSSLAKSNGMVLLGTGGAYAICALLSLVGKVGKYLPTSLINMLGLVKGEGSVSDYMGAVILTFIFSVMLIIAGMLIFNKREIG